jgi:hypothetical protein
MNEHSYIDIFATKGIEYIIVVVYLVIFVLFMKALRGNAKSSEDSDPAVGMTKTDGSGSEE